VSYDCLTKVMESESRLDTMTAPRKLTMFDPAVHEIEILIYVSVLNQFYESNEFKEINLSRMNSDGHIARPFSPTRTPWKAKLSQSVNLIHIETKQSHPGRSNSHHHIHSERALRGYNNRPLSLFDAVSTTENGGNDKSQVELNENLEVKSPVALKGKLPRSKSDDIHHVDPMDQHSVPLSGGVSTVISPNASTIRTISTEFELDEPPSNSPICAVPTSPAPPSSGIRPYRQKTCTVHQHKANDETPPILVNLSHSTESVFHFEYEASPSTVLRRRRSGSTTLIDKMRSAEHKLISPRHHRSRTSPSNTNSPRIQSPKSFTSTRRSMQLLSPSCSNGNAETPKHLKVVHDLE